MKKYLVLIFLLIVIGLGIFFLIKNLELFIKSESGPDNKSQESQLDRQEIMQDVPRKIGELSPEEPVLGGNWYVDRFWFVQDDNKDFYVEYEDGHILRRILLSAEKKNDKLYYDLIGYFEPGETTWDLKRGDDLFSGRTLDLYEYSEETGRWMKKN